MKIMKTIFFINDTVPTKKELEFASKIEGKIVFRNVQFFPHDFSEGSIEKCDYVCGNVPEIYAKKFKVIDFESEHEEKRIVKKETKKPVPKWKPNK
jgi:hypothetical protein